MKTMFPRLVIGGLKSHCIQSASVLTRDRMNESPEAI